MFVILPNKFKFVHMLYDQFNLFYSKLLLHFFLVQMDYLYM